MTLSLSTPAPATPGPFIWYESDIPRDDLSIETVFGPDSVSSFITSRVVVSDLKPVKVDDLRGKW